MSECKEKMHKMAQSEAHCHRLWLRYAQQQQKSHQNQIYRA